MLEGRDRRRAQELREIAMAVSVGRNPGKKGENIALIKPVLEQGKGEDASRGVQWWPDDEG